jgi:hypothetical protein
MISYPKRLQYFAEKFKTLKHKPNSVVPYGGGGTLVQVLSLYVFARQWKPQELDNLQKKGHFSTFISWLRFKFDSQKRKKINFFPLFSHRLGWKWEERFLTGNLQIKASNPSSPLQESFWKTPDEKENKHYLGFYFFIYIRKYPFLTLEVFFIAGNKNYKLSI